MLYRKIAAVFLLLGCSPTLIFAQLAPEGAETVDREVVNKIKEEGTKNSQVMETLSFLTDVYGPRLTAAPETKVAGEWAKNKLGEWGLQNGALEKWGPFGRGWTVDRFSANIVAPNYSSLIAYPKAWSPSMPKAVRGTPVYFDAAEEKDLEKFRGKLRQAVVLLAPPREVKPVFDPLAARKTDAELLALANGEGSLFRSFRGAPPAAPGGSPQPNALGGPSGRFGQTPEQRAARAMQAAKMKMIYEEGAAIVLEPGRGDGGTVFVSQVSMAGATGGSGSPWAPDAPAVIPQAVLAVEHYNRLVRMIQKGAPVEVEIDLQTRFHGDDLNTFNVIAEIPGTDLKDEVVMLGGHFDSWHSGTGATDNAIGCGVAMEAVRILQAIGVKPRRTIRIALWTGEEQGLLGSRAYVGEHFGKALGGGAGGGRGGRSGGPGGPGGPGGAAGEGATIGEGQPPAGPPRRRFELKPEHDKFAGYFNLDNGTGKIRGVYLQGNEACRPIFRAWLAPFAEMGASTIASSNTGGTDHLSFDGVGLPGFQFIQDQMEYDTRTHHSSMDVYERLQAEDIKQASMIMASFVYHTAMRNEKLPRKPLNGEIVKPEAAAAAEAPKTEEPKTEAATDGK
jgi:carboxypeptidase Q